MGKPNVPHLVQLTKDYAAKGQVDNLNNLKDDNVYIFSGKDDTVIVQEVVKSLQDYYENFVAIDKMVADYSIPAEHCFPTLNYGEPCSTLKSPYIGKCNFDGAYMALSTIYGEPF